MITTAQLKEKVRQLINEAASDTDVTLLADDTRNIDEHIEALLPDAVLFVQINSDRCGLNPKGISIETDEIYTEDSCGSIVLPDDFVRLVSFDVEGWGRPCTVLYPADSPVALAQSNLYTRAGCCKPVCIESIGGNGKRRLRFYPLPSGSSPSLRSFVYEAVYRQGGSLSGNDEALIKAVAYRCAALLYNVFEKNDSANAFFAISAALCSSNQTNKNE